jgi:cullin 1
MCILYLFNYNKELTLDEIREHMGFDEETAKKNIQSMMQPRARLIVMDNGKYKVNMQYSNKLTRITFPVPVLEELVKRERVTQDRSNAVDAAVVRIMKSRKKLGVNQLKIEVITLMQTFKPDDALIKRRIENLIEREYLERDKADQSQLLYKA